LSGDGRAVSSSTHPTPAFAPHASDPFPASPAALLAWAAAISGCRPGRTPVRVVRRHQFALRLAGVIACDRPAAPKQSATLGNYRQTRHDRPDERLAPSGASLEVSFPSALISRVAFACPGLPAFEHAVDPINAVQLEMADARGGSFVDVSSHEMTRLPSSSTSGAGTSGEADRTLTKGPPFQAPPLRSCRRIASCTIALPWRGVPLRRSDTRGLAGTILSSFLPAFLARRRSWDFHTLRRFAPADGWLDISADPGPPVVFAARSPRLILVGCRFKTQVLNLCVRAASTSGLRSRLRSDSPAPLPAIDPALGFASCRYADALLRMRTGSTPIASSAPGIPPPACDSEPRVPIRSWASRESTLPFSVLMGPMPWPT
jgi:hypothetical protein